MTPRSDAHERPNVLMILTDDQGWDDLAHHGNPCLETPRLDALARESVEFANYYVASVCAPSRASLLTGRHFLRTGVAHVHGGKDFVHPDETMIGEVFRDAGYRTAMWGKWHSGKTTGYFPWERGFDEAYMAGLYRHRDNRGRFNGERREHEGWTVDTLTDYAIEFMERSREEPFFIFLPYLTCHAPLVAPEELIGKYEEKGLGSGLATIYAMLDQLDTNIGRLLDTMEDLGLAEETVVLFMSDNGPAYLPGRITEEDLRRRYVNGYKGHKGNMWENGIKSPLFVRRPGRFEPHTVGRLCDICDVFPTLLDICGIEPPGDLPPLDGRSILPYLEGDEEALPPKESYIYVSPGWPPDPTEPWSPEGRFREYDPVPPEEKPELPVGVQLVSLRDEEWKLLRNPGEVPDAPEPVDGQVLIHIAEDPREDRNLAASEEDVLEAMRGKLTAWFEEVKREPHSFHTPTFKLGPGTTNFVAGYAPVRVRGSVLNGATFSMGWGAPGDGADYLIDVTEPGRYALRMGYRKQPGRSATVRLRAADALLTARIEAEEEQELGVMDLPAGPYKLSVDILEADRGQGPVIERLHRISFQPLS